MDAPPQHAPYLPGTMTCRALDLLCDGCTSREIAAVLGNSPATVDKLLIAAARALGLRTCRRVPLALAWTRLCPKVDEPQTLEPQPDGPTAPPIYTLIDGMTGQRLGGPHPTARERHAQDERIEVKYRRTALHPRRPSVGPRPTHSRAEVGYRGITNHARWVLRKRVRACQRCAYTLCVDVCHIRPVHTFAPEALLAEINAPQNLIYLCPNCHRELDAGLWILGGEQEPAAP